MTGVQTCALPIWRKLNDALAQGLDGRALASVSVHAVIKMIFEDGFFHADPHPGNLLVLGPNDAPVVGLLDLGLVGHLSGATRDRALDLMVAAAREDYSAVADALYALGRPTRKVDMAAFRTDVETLGRKYVGRALGEIEVAAVVRDLIWGAVKHGIDMPPDFMLVGRALMTLEGTARQIDAGLRPAGGLDRGDGRPGGHHLVAHPLPRRRPRPPLVLRQPPPLRDRAGQIR